MYYTHNEIMDYYCRRCLLSEYVKEKQIWCNKKNVSKQIIVERVDDELRMVLIKRKSNSYYRFPSVWIGGGFLLSCFEKTELTQFCYKKTKKINKKKKRLVLWEKRSLSGNERVYAPLH